MRKRAGLFTIVIPLIVLTSGCTTPSYDGGVSPEVQEKVSLQYCSAYIDGGKVVAGGQIVSDLPGSKNFKVEISGKSLKNGINLVGEKHVEREEIRMKVPGHGNLFEFGHNLTVSDEWRRPGVDEVNVTLRLFAESWEGHWGIVESWTDTIPLVYLDTDRCSIGTGFVENVEYEFVLHAVFVNDQPIGSQIVEYEPYIEYELIDGTTDSQSEVLVETIPPSRRGGNLGFRPTYMPWPVGLPAPRESIARLVAGVRAGGAEWNETILG